MSRLPIGENLEGHNEHAEKGGDDDDEEDVYGDGAEEDGDIYGVSGVTFQFKDTLNFQKDTLANLVTRLDKAGRNLSILRQSSLVLDKNKTFSHRLFKLAHRKIPFAYEYLTGLEVLKNRHPPTIGDFKSTLGIGSSVKLSEYEDFLDTWRVLEDEKFGTNMCMGTYLEFYNW